MISSAGPGSFGWIQSVRAVALVGICKNAGKTTLLNHLLVQRQQGVWGVFSTGIDGEEQDSVFRVPKPPVKLDPDTLFCCDTPILDKLGSSVEVLEKFSPGSAPRQLWLARSLSPLQTEITGPGSVSLQISVLNRMRSLGARKVLIDGSLDRKSIAFSADVDAVAVLIGASFGPLTAIIGEIRRLELLNYLPTLAVKSQERAMLAGSAGILSRRNGRWSETGLGSLLGSEKALKRLLEEGLDAIYIPGALTDVVYDRIREALAASKAQMIFRHPECLKLSLNRLERCLEELRPRVLIPFRIRAWVLNSASVGARAIDTAEFRAKLRQAFPSLDLPDLMELAE